MSARKEHAARGFGYARPIMFLPTAELVTRFIAYRALQSFRIARPAADPRISPSPTSLRLPIPAGT